MICVPPWFQLVSLQSWALFVAYSHNMSKKLVLNPHRNSFSVESGASIRIISDKPGECTETMMAPTGTLSQTLAF